jgi:putative sterol carrier protein
MAAAISKGEVHPTQALGTGEIRVRGDLAVLVAGQAVLAAAAAHLSDLQATTTY